MAIVLTMLFGIALMLGPPIADIMGHSLGPMMSSILMISGLIVSIFSGFLLILTKLWVKTKADEAFVRTGVGGEKAIIGGGAIVIPFLHEIVRVPLRQIKLEVKRNNEQAMITGDYLRCDIAAEFYLTVKKENEAVLAAAKTFGDKLSESGLSALKAQIEEKLVSVLRNVAATKPLKELNTNRDEFIREVSQQIAGDLKEDGLTLVTPTISALDQTSVEFMNDANVFDAEGKETIAKITEAAKTRRNILERNGEQDRKMQDVETKKKVLTMEQDQANAEARQKAEVLKIQATQQQEAREKQIEAQQIVELAEVQKAKMVEVENKRKESMVAVEDEKKQQAMEVAAQVRASAVAEAEANKAKKETEQATAEQARQAAQERIAMVKIEQDAERKKRQAVLHAEAAAEQKLIADMKAADAKAYTVEKDAEARKKAADADATAIKTKADAQKEAQIAQAEGQRAVEMIPVDVKKADVAAEKARVNDVTIPEMKARQDFGRMDIEFQLGQSQIEANKEVEIARAAASVEIGKKFEVKAYATMPQVASMMRSLMTGQTIAEGVNNLTENLDPKTVETATGILGAVKDQVSGLLGGGSGGSEAKTGTQPSTPAPPAVGPAGGSAKAARKVASTPPPKDGK